MQRRNFSAQQFNPILLYGPGLTLALPLPFNGFLLLEQRDKGSIHEYESGKSVNPADRLFWQEQLADCRWAKEQKDSLLNQLAKLPGGPSDKKIANQGSP